MAPKEDDWWFPKRKIGGSQIGYLVISREDDWWFPYWTIGGSHTNDGWFLKMIDALASYPHICCHADEHVVWVREVVCKLRSKHPLTLLRMQASTPVVRLGDPGMVQVRILGVLRKTTVASWAGLEGLLGAIRHG